MEIVLLYAYKHEQMGAISRNVLVELIIPTYGQLLELLLVFVHLYHINTTT